MRRGGSVRSHRWVDDLETLEWPFGEGRLHGLIEDEFLHELRSLQERKCGARVVGKVLVQITEKPRGELRIGEVMDGLAIGVAFAPEVDDCGGGGSRRAE